MTLRHLILTRLKDLGIRKVDLATRIGYQNIPKGCRRIDAILSDCDLTQVDLCAQKLADALEVDEETLSQALAATRAEIEAEERSRFLPHATLIPEDKRPSLTKAYLRTVRFSRGSDPSTYRQQSMDQLPERARIMGPVAGFRIHYEYDRAVDFDRQGKPICT